MDASYGLLLSLVGMLALCISIYGVLDKNE
jgi:hypothetical protein